MTITGYKSLQPEKHLFSIAPGQKLPVVLLVQVPPVADRKNGDENDNQDDSNQQHEHKRGFGINDHGSPFVPPGKQVGKNAESQDDTHWQAILDIFYKPALPEAVSLQESNKPLFLVV